MRTCIYARVSTQLLQNPELQVNALKEIAKNRGWDIEYIYIDKISGGKSSKERPELSNLMADAKQGRFQNVMIYSLDRLARSVEHFISITNELKSLNINIFSMRESLDLSTPTGRAFAQMMSVMAELERGIIQERVLLGVRNAIKKRGSWGRPSGVTTQVIDNVIKLRKEKNGIRKIAKLNKIGVSSVYNILKSKEVA